MEVKTFLAKNYVNFRGWKTKRKIVVIESDDWGSIRMNNKDSILYFDLHYLPCVVPADSHTHFEKNVTYNIALKSTTYVKRNVTLHVTTSRTNVTDCLGLLPHGELVHEDAPRKFKAQKSPPISREARFLTFVRFSRGYQRLRPCPRILPSDCP